MPQRQNRAADSAMQNEVEDLSTELNSTLITKRIKSVKALGKLKTQLAVEPLKRVLNDRSSEVRCVAIEALELIKPPKLSAMLQCSIKDKSANVRLRAAHALGTCKDLDSVELLLVLIKDSRDEVGAMAAKSLSKLSSLSLTFLIRLFADESWKVRSRAASAASGVGSQAINALKAGLNDADSNVRFWSAVCIGRLHNREHCQLLLEKLNDKDESVKIAVLRALREIGDYRAAPKLFEAISQSSEQVRDLIFEILKDFGAHSIPYLINSLSSEYKMGKEVASQALADMGSEAVLPLVSTLKSQNKEERCQAIKILGKMNEKSAYNTIKACLSDSDAEIRMASLEALGCYLNPESLQAIIEKFTDPTWIVRKYACAAVIKFGVNAVSLLIKAISSSKEDIRFWALRALGEIKPLAINRRLIKLFNDCSYTIRKTASDVLAGYGESAIAELTELASDGGQEARYWALRSLGKIKSQMSLPMLFNALGDESEAIREAAQKALANYGKGIIDDLFSLLKSDKRRVLESVCLTFCRLDPEIVLPVLCKNLGRFDEHVSYWVRRSLVLMKENAHSQALALLESPESETRRQAVLCLGEMGFLQDASQLLHSLKDESWPVRIAAAASLGKLSASAAVLPLCQALEDSDEDLAAAAIAALGLIGDERAVPSLISALQRESWVLKFQAVKILGEMRAARAFIDLLQMLDEDTLDLKPHIIKALARINHQRCFAELKRRFLKETETEIKIAYIEALSEIGNADITVDFIKIAEDKTNQELQAAAIKALGRLKAEAARPVLIKALKNKNLAISREALCALEAILPPEEFLKTEKAINEARKRQEAFQKAFNEGMKQMRLNDMAKAEGFLKEAIKINPKAPYVYSALGNLYYRGGKLIDATKAYVMATKIRPDDITLKLNLAMVYYRRRAYKEAWQIFSAVTKATDPTSQQYQYADKMLARIKAAINAKK